MQDESLAKRVAERRKRIAVKNSMNSSLYSDIDHQPMTASNAYFQASLRGKDFPMRPSSTKGAGSGFFFGRGKMMLLPTDSEND
jgi:hypothetical protein